MTTILGMSVPKFITRLAWALANAVVLIAIFLYIPSLLLSRVPSFGEGLSSGLYVYFVLTIAAIGVVQSVFRNTYLGDAASIANGIAEILYLILITNDGILSFSLPGGNGLLTLNFQPILYLFLVPPALAVVGAVTNAVSRNSMKELIHTEELMLR